MLTPDMLRRQNAEVWYVPGPFTALDDADTALLKTLAADTPRRRCRFCFHTDPSAPLHEMLIVHHRDAYVRPHRHLGKSESLCTLEGEACAFLFDGTGAVLSHVSMTPPRGGGAFHYWMPAGIWHSLVIRSEWFLFLEATQGPFDPAQTEFPPWAPDGVDADAAARFVAGLNGAG